MLDGIIFDVDGTLWDARAQVIQEWRREKLELTGRPLGLTDEQLTALFGRSMADIALALFPECDAEQAQAYGEICFARECERLRQNPGVLYDEVAETVALLSQSYPLYIVSNCQCGYIEVLLETQGLTPYFSGHLCYGDTLTEKDVTIHRLMKQYGIERTVYVGDTQGDASACRSAGIPFVFAAYGLGSVTDTYPTIYSPNELPELLKKLESNTEKTTRL